MNAVERFATEAANFERWLLTATDEGADAAREALLRLVGLYHAGLELPADELRDGEAGTDADWVDPAAWHVARDAAARLPFDRYSRIPDTTASPVEPVSASLADDLAHIYHDLVTGLRAYERGERARAVWHWGVPLETHWGSFATGAIHALHVWLGAHPTEEAEIEDSAG